MEITLPWISFLGRRAAPVAALLVWRQSKERVPVLGINMKRVGVCHLISLVGERRLQASDAIQHSLFPCSYSFLLLCDVWMSFRYWYSSLRVHSAPAVAPAISSSHLASNVSAWKAFPAAQPA